MKKKDAHKPTFFFIRATRHVNNFDRKTEHSKDPQSAAIFDMIILSKKQMTAGIAEQKASTQAHL